MFIFNTLAFFLEPMVLPRLETLLSIPGFRVLEHTPRDIMTVTLTTSA